MTYETRNQRLDRQAQFGMTQTEKDNYDRLAEADLNRALAHKAAHQALIDKTYADAAARAEEVENDHGYWSR